MKSKRRLREINVRAWQRFACNWLAVLYNSTTTIATHKNSTNMLRRLADCCAQNKTNTSTHSNCLYRSDSLQWCVCVRVCFSMEQCEHQSMKFHYVDCRSFYVCLSAHTAFSVFFQHIRITFIYITKESHSLRCSKAMVYCSIQKWMMNFCPLLTNPAVFCCAGIWNSFFSKLTIHHLLYELFCVRFFFHLILSLSFFHSPNRTVNSDEVPCYSNITLNNVHFDIKTVSLRSTQKSLYNFFCSFPQLAVGCEDVCQLSLEKKVSSYSWVLPLPRFAYVIAMNNRDGQSFRSAAPQLCVTHA